MFRPQFDIKTLLILTAVVGCGLTFAIQTGNWLVALLVTVLLTTVAAAIVALVVFVLIPNMENRSGTGDQVDAD